MLAARTYLDAKGTPQDHRRCASP